MILLIIFIGTIIISQMVGFSLGHHLGDFKNVCSLLLGFNNAIVYYYYYITTSR